MRTLEEEQVKNFEPIEDDLTLFLTSGSRLLFSVFMHWTAKYVFLFLAILTFSEWLRTSYYATHTR
jgi:hypothetical protein